MEKKQSRPGRWHKLDNTANLFPVIASKRATNVYRISVNLDEPVIPELLQRALELALPWFAALQVRLRRGIFWHYLEHNAEIPRVQEEDDFPCRYIDPKQNNHFLFRLTYFKKRINLEVFHVLTDGTGGYDFLLAIACQYLMLAHPDAYSEEDKQKHWCAGHAADTEDSYVKNYVPTKKASFREGRGFRLKGDRDILGKVSVTHAHLAMPGLKALCKQKECTITQYITACIIWGIYRDQGAKGRKHPINLFMPVNLRNLFGSNTSLNFFSNVYISVDQSARDLTFDGILQSVRQQFEEKITKQYMLERISYTVGSGYNPWIRPVPLPLKILALRAIYEVSAKSSTLSFSNMGKINVPEPFRKHVTGVSLLLSTTPGEPLKCTCGSYGDTLTFSIASTLRSPSIQKEIIRTFSGDGLDVTVETNGVDYESM